MILKNYWRKQIAAFSAFAVLSTTILGGTVFGAASDGTFKLTTTQEESQREKENKELSEFAATQGMVLLQNENDVLPVAKNTKIALFGGGAYVTVKGGGGSGEVNERKHDNVWEGLADSYEITSKSWLEDFKKGYEDETKAAAADYGEWAKTHNPYAGDSYEGYEGTYVSYTRGLLGATLLAKDIKLEKDDITDAAGADVGMYVLTRYSTEGADWPKDTPGYYDISDTDLDNIELIAKSFDKSVLILNVGGVINAKQIVDMKAKGLDSVILMSQAGMLGGHALAKVLTGEVTPSGKTVDTWAAKYDDYPSAECFSNNDTKYKYDEDGNIVKDAWGNPVIEFDGDEEEDYKEGIFVGYRYFDTFGVDPVWEFGYGLSYTDFNITTDTNADTVEVDEAKDSVNVTVSVSNIGSQYSGSEVVQVYFSGPEGGLAKPYQELIGYEKTNELKPGEFEELTVNFKLSDMSSYSEEKAAYILEKGDYYIRVGNSSRCTSIVAKLTLDKDVITEQLSTLKFGAEDNSKVDDEIEKKEHTHITYAEEKDEMAKAPEIDLDSSKIEKIDCSSPYTDESITAFVSSKDVHSYDVPADGFYDQTIRLLENAGDYKTLQDVYNAPKGKRTEALYSLISQMSYEELGTIVEGIGMGGFSGAVPDSEINGTYCSTPGAAGETTFALYEKYGIPNTVLSDGPAGIRINQSYERNDTTYYQYATAFPIGTLLAQTWDKDLIYQVGKAVGEEMKEFGVTLWLAPGMNIHRNPLCGRNFEYYSEDPLVTGMTGAFITNGVQSNEGVGVTIKHYTTNNQEDNRNSEDNRVSERAMREIYLKGFEITVKEANPMALMTCYNRINGTFGAGNFDTVTNALRGEWGFNGVVMTDWMSGEAPYNSMHAGNDMIQPGGNPSEISNYLDDVNVAPTFGEDGYVTVTYGWTGMIENWNEFAPYKEGKSAVSTKALVKWDNAPGSTDKELIEAALTKLNANVKAYVDDEIAEVTVADNSQYPASTEFNVTYKGDYIKINLGDVQRSAFNILKMVMASNQYGLSDEDAKVTTFDKYITDKWSDEAAVDISKLGVEVPNEVKPTEPDKPAEPTEEEKKKAEIEKEISENKATMSANVALDDKYSVEYNRAIPFFGKNFGKDFTKVFGEIKVKVGDKTVKATKIKVVRIKGADSTSWNAAIQIVKTDDKTVNKDVKKLTKVDKKNKDGNKLPIIIYAMNLDNAVDTQIEGVEVKGKAGKHTLKFKFKETGKKFTAKEKKDSFGKAYTKFEKNAAGDWIIESGDLKGTLSANKITDKSK